MEITIIPGEDQGGVSAVNELDIPEGEKERLAAVAVLVASDENKKESAKVDTAAEKKAKRMAGLAQLKAKKMEDGGNSCK